ncbi:hypothetical protein BH10PSE3_BH10PSE3_03920 [soil metagenome]
MAVTEDTYTFLGTTQKGDPVFMDIAVLPTEGAAVRHCAQLFQSHGSGSLVEVWRGAGLITTVAREPSYDTVGA